MSKAERRTPRRTTTPAAKPARKRTAAPRLPADLEAAIRAAEDKKTLDLVVLDLRKGSAFTDFFVICTGATGRQVKAIANGVEDALRKKGVKPALVEGYSRAEWILLDYFNFIVHVFTPTTREFYALERLWGDAEVLKRS